MSAPIPCAGFRSRTEAVVQLGRLGLTDAQIAEKLGISPNNVAALRASSKRRMRPAERDGKTVVVPRETLTLLEAPASARAITPNELVRRLLDIIAEESLSDAILDDGGDDADPS